MEIKTKRKINLICNSFYGEGPCYISIIRFSFFFLRGQRKKKNSNISMMENKVNKFIDRSFAVIAYVRSDDGHLT